MRRRGVFLGLSLLVLAAGVFLYVSTISRQTSSSWYGWNSNGPVSGQKFSYTGETLAPQNQTTITAGTTGIGDLMILKSSVLDFNRWICPFLTDYRVYVDGHRNCDALAADGARYNTTILESYLDAHPGVILSSRTLVNENVTVTYPVSEPMNVTIVLANVGTGMAREFWKGLTTDSTIVYYPMIGYRERYFGSSLLTLPNVSLYLASIGAAGLALALVYNRAKTGISIARQVRSKGGPTLRECPGCGNENLYFAEKCGHCGRTLRRETLGVPAPAK